MKYIPAIAIFFLSGLILNSCKKESTPKTVETQGIIGLEECLEFSDPCIHKVCLTNIQDSRCRCDSYCIWAGIATYTLYATGPGIDSVFTLHPPGNVFDTPSNIQLGSCKLDITEIYPSTCTGLGDVEDYQLQVTITD